MRLINKIVLLIILFSLVIFKPDVMAKELKDGKKNTGLSKTTGTPATTWFTINNVNTILRNDGMSDLNGNDSGFEFPAGSNHSAFYESGFIYGGYYKGEWRVGGSAYDHSQLPGRILADGTAESGSLPAVRIYRVRRDYKSADADFSREMAKQGLTKAQVIDQYTKDWNEWPAAYGAPYEDVNGNKQYDPTVDIPGVPGADQTIWFVANDLDPSPQTKFYGTLGLGMEMQATFWGYNTSGALGNAMFRKYQMINKGGQNIDSMFVCMWSDPDLGDAGDDYTGCDTTLSLGYIYNGKTVDATYGPNVPAAGFDFFQGPIVKGTASEQAVFKGKYKAGYKNLPMSAFFFFINSDAVYRDPTQGDKVGAQHWKNLFTGKISTTGVPFKDPTTGKNTKFTLSGDPITGRGWIDGIIHRPGDRRLGMVAGPFTFAAKDTQEVVVGQFAAGATAGVNNLQAVGLLKFNDIELQNTYNVFFQVPPAVKAPQVTAAALDQKVTLVWGDRPDIYNVTESYNNLGYKFQGYVVYQLPKLGATVADGKEVATYDLVDLVGNIQSLVFDPVSGTSTTKFTKHGLNTGIARSIEITKDLVRNAPIVNGTHYYFAVTAYAYNPDPNAVPNVLETPLTILDVVPQASNPGYTLPTAATAITVAHTSGASLSDGSVTPVLINPAQVTGHNYEVTFATVSGKNLWSMVDKTTGVTKLSNQAQDQAGQSPIVDGLQIQVKGAPNDFKRFLVTANSGGKLATPNMGAFAFNGNGFPTLDGAAANGVNDRPVAGQQKTNASLWGIHTGATGIGGSTADGGDASYTKFLGRVARNDNFTRIVPYDYEIRFTASGSKAQMAFTDGAIVDVPFEVWNTGIGTPNDTKDDYKCVALVYDTDANGKFNLTKQDHPVSGGDNDPETDWIYIYDVTDHTPGTKGYDAAVASKFDDGNTTTVGKEIMARLVLVNFNGGSVSAANWPANVNSQMPETGTIFRIESTKPNQPGTTGDKFTFTAPSVTYSADKAKSDVELINAFPNPYYGANPRETDKYVRFITISHLPKVATLRIFNLAGQLVNTIKKDDASPYTTWNLANDGGIPVASGLYIVHVEMPEIGSTKILKIAIIQEQQILDRF